MAKSASLFISFLFLVGCATGGTNLSSLDTGTMKTEYVRDTGFHTKGGTMEIYYLCDEDGNSCKKVGELVVSNPTLLQQVFGGVSAVGSAALIGEGLKGSGDNVNNVNQQAQGQKQHQRQRQNNGRMGWGGD